MGLENRLETEWPSYSKSNEKFWAHEWEKHGKCAKKDGNVIAEKTYFSTALELNKKFNILSVLKDNHIVPSLNKLYKVSDIHSALEKSFGVKVQLSCATKEETTYLTETRICLDLHFKKIDCNAMLSCQPDAKVKYIASGSRSIITQHFGSIHPFLFSLLFLLIPLW